MCGTPGCDLADFHLGGTWGDRPGQGRGLRFTRIYRETRTDLSRELPVQPRPYIRGVWCAVLGPTGCAIGGILVRGANSGAGVCKVKYEFVS